MKMQFSTFLVVFFSLISCKEKKETSFYIVNNSFFSKEDTIQVYINEKLIINEIFSYSDVVPNDKLFKVNLNGRHADVRVKELKYGSEAIDSIDVLNEKYVFISFNESKKSIPHPDSLKRRIIIHKRKKYTKIY